MQSHYYAYQLFKKFNLYNNGFSMIIEIENGNGLRVIFWEFSIKIMKNLLGISYCQNDVLGIVSEN